MRRPHRSLLFLLLTAAIASCEPAPEQMPNPEAPRAPGERSIRAVPFTAVTIQDAFWKPLLDRNREVTIPHIMEQNELTGRVDNFRRAAGLMEGPYEGRRFNDTDLYKVIEAASYALADEYDAALDAALDEQIALIAAVQEEDGYLVPARTVDPENPAAGLGAERWIHVSNGSHELYNAGHLIEAAVAHYQATGKRSLLDVAIAFADLIDRDFGPDARADIPGHEEIEVALVKLADVTGEMRYTDLAHFLLEGRGRPHDGADYPEGDFAIYNDLPYKQDHIPVAEQAKASGHAVRAMYLYMGMSDVATRLGIQEYEAALDDIWGDVVSNKLYLTGGIGSRGTFESFGEDYELPNRAYAESCAAVGNDLWNHRMFLSYGDARYLDVMERVLYNGSLSGISASGGEFFYTNVLESDGRDARSEYFDVACCPANLARLMSQLPGFVYATRSNMLFVNLFVGSQAEVELPSGALRVTQQTDYPWNGRVRIELQPAGATEFTLQVRIPGWARGVAMPSDLYVFDDAEAPAPTLAINGEAVDLQPERGWATLHRTWQPGDVIELDLPMPVRRVRAHEAVEDAAGRVALQRGPVVYAAEGIDNGGGVLDLTLPDAAVLRAERKQDIGVDVTLIEGTALRNGREVPFTAIPYFAWANRGAGEMAVWLSRR
jgi:DUF1680 family protein